MYSFTDKPLPKYEKNAREIREALTRLLDAELDLQEAKSRVPGYTAQFIEEDYYRDEEAECIKASNNLVMWIEDLAK